MSLFSKKGSTTLKPKPLTFSLPPGAILVPVVSEKSTRLQTMGQYLFSVIGKVNKIETKKAVESIFGVRVVGVNSIGLPGKVVRRGRVTGRRRARRHLVVRLAPGESIDFSKTL